MRKGSDASRRSHEKRDHRLLRGRFERDGRELQKRLLFKNPEHCLRPSDSQSPKGPDRPVQDRILCSLQTDHGQHLRDDPEALRPRNDGT